MLTAVWRLRALETPMWSQHCRSCGRQRDHRSTQLFRVNAQAARHDVWLLYRCASCDTTRKRRLFRRARIAQLSEGRLERYLQNHSGAAWQHAFEVRSQAPLRYRVERDPLPNADELEVVIEQPFFCALRWDRFLAAELGWSRGRIARGWQRGLLSPDCPSMRARDCVLDGQRVRVRLIGSIGSISTRPGTRPRPRPGEPPPAPHSLD